MRKYVDAHVHAYEYNEEALKSYERDFLLLSVSDDIESSRKTLNMPEVYSNVIPCIGIHPWKVEKASKEALNELENMIDKMTFPCIGEVGLDKKFVPETFELQIEVFGKLLMLAKEYDALLNIHAAGAWKEAIDFLLKYDVNRAIIHWYTGPKELVTVIENSGFYLSINVAFMFQKKHEEIAKLVRIDRMLTESDGPYVYRGNKLTTELIPKALANLSILKNTKEEDLVGRIKTNFLELLK